MSYNVVVCDPPYTYNSKKMGGSMKSGSAQKYNTLTLDEIKDIGTKLQDKLEKDCILFLWATIPLLPEAIEVMKSWGFKYKTSIIWHKSNINGPGWHYRGVIEMLLVGFKGKVKAFRYQHPNIISTKVLKHSQKPDEFRKLIQDSVSIKDPKFLELFATKQYEKWTCIGYNIDGLDIHTAIERLKDV